MAWLDVRLYFVVGLLLHGNPLVAFVVGALVMVVEIALIDLFAKGMESYRALRISASMCVLL